MRKMVSVQKQKKTGTRLWSGFQDTSLEGIKFCFNEMESQYPKFLRDCLSLNVFQWIC